MNRFLAWLEDALPLTLIIVFSLLMVSRCSAQWKSHDIALATTSTTFIALDLLTSTNMIRRMDAVTQLCVKEPNIPDCKLHETNPLLGKHPSLTKIRVVSAIGAAGNLVVASRLQGKWRTLWLAGVTTVEFIVVKHNVNIGLRFAL